MTVSQFHYDASLFPGADGHSARFKVASAAGYEGSTVQGPTAISGGPASGNFTSCIRVRQPDSGTFSVVFWLPVQGAKFDTCERSKDGTNWESVTCTTNNGNYEWTFKLSSSTNANDLVDYSYRFRASGEKGSTIQVSVRPRAKTHPIWELLGFGEPGTEPG